MMVMTKIKIIMKMRVKKGSYMKRDRSLLIALRLVGRGKDFRGGSLEFWENEYGRSVVTENPKGGIAENF